MLIPKKNRIEVYSYLINNGVLVAKKDPFAPKHHELEIPNLHVLKLLQSMKSRGFVTEQFNWQFYYWYLTNEGIEYLREYLHLPDTVLPATLRKPKPTSRPFGAPREGGRGEGREGGRGGFGKRAPFSGDEKPEFRGGDREGGRGGRGGFEGGRGGFEGGRGGRGGFGRGGSYDRYRREGDEGRGGYSGRGGFEGGRGGYEGGRGGYSGEGGRGGFGRGRGRGGFGRGGAASAGPAEGGSN
eukprot:TRINITY_DN24_c0_g1_i1.p1 TRINITY_DN24_c0_g1~~TRINITY_DN24_c0_g1_i1.p1  ORF type:complete len:241 (+),score=77.68 TRINITY_DN24_c0_g1_i1:138-860(+)